MIAKNSKHILQVEQHADHEVPVISLMKFFSSQASTDTEDDQEQEEVVEVVEERLNDVVKQCCIWIKEVPQPLLVEEDPIFVKKRFEKVDFEINNSDEDSNSEPIRILSPPDSPIKTEIISLLSPPNSPINTKALSLMSPPNSPTKTQATTARKSTRRRTAKIITDYGSTEHWPSSRPTLKSSRVNKVRRGSLVEDITNKCDKLEECSTRVNEKLLERKLSDSLGALISVDSSTNQQTHSTVPLKRVSSRNRIPTRKCCEDCYDLDSSSSELDSCYSPVPRSRNQTKHGKLRKKKKVSKKVRFSETPIIENVPEYFEDHSLSEISTNDCSIDSDSSIIVVDDEPACSEVPETRVSITNRIIKTCSQACSPNTNGTNGCYLHQNDGLENPPKVYSRLSKTHFKKNNDKSKSMKTFKELFIHKHLERKRREILSKLFQGLKAQIPSIQRLDSKHSTKNIILNEAVTYINELRLEAKSIDNQTNFLLSKQNRLIQVLCKKINEVS